LIEPALPELPDTLAAGARRIGAPYPALLAFAGAALALMPGTPEVMLDPELALALFVARCCSTRRSTPLPGTCGKTGGRSPASHWSPWPSPWPWWR
jgi:hypothetical protein